MMAGEDDDEFYDSDEDFVWKSGEVLSLTLEEEGGINEISSFRIEELVELVPFRGEEEMRWGLERMDRGRAEERDGSERVGTVQKNIST